MRTSGRLRRPESLYLCVVLDQFSAQVIAARDPSYRHEPFVVVQQNAESHKSRVWACSVMAKRMAIRPGTPVQHLKTRHRELEVVFRDDELEKIVCGELSQILYGYSPEYEIKPNGECLLSLAGTPMQRQMEPRAIAVILRSEIRYKTGLQEIAVGIAHTKLMARITARQVRPDGFGIREEEEAALASLDVRFLPGLSGQCREKLKKYGLRRVGQIGKLSKSALIRRFGNEGEKLYSLANGTDSKDVVVPMRVFDAETVLDHDINDNHVLTQNVRHAVDRLCYQLKTEGLQIEKLTLALRYTDNKCVRKTLSLPSSTDDFLTIAEAATATFEQLYQRRVAIRSLRLTVNSPQKNTGQQELFETTWERKQKSLSAGITAARRKTRFDALLSGSDIGVVKA